MTEIPLPLPEALHDLLSELLSNRCQVDGVEEALVLSPELPSVLAEYVDPEGAVLGAAIADLGFVSRSGSALVMMPVEGAEEAVAAGSVDGDLLDCYKEVANVLTRLLTSADTPHLRLRGLFQSGQLIPGELRAVLASPHRRDFHVTIEEYGAGRLAVIMRSGEIESAAA